MARSFIAASEESLDIDVGVLTAYPITMACWFLANDITNNYVLVGLFDKGETNKRLYLMAYGDQGGDPLRAYADSREALTSSGYSADIWQHGCAIFGATNDRRVYLNGGSKGTNSQNDTVDPANLDRFSVGRAGDFTPAAWLDGQVAEVALWSAILTDAEVAILAKGYSPLFVRPLSLIFYTPLIRNADNDIVGGLHLTESGTPTISAHPGIIYPWSQFGMYGFAAAAPAASITVLVAAYLNSRRRLKGDWLGF